MTHWLLGYTVSYLSSTKVHDDDDDKKRQPGNQHVYTQKLLYFNFSISKLKKKLVSKNIFW